MKACGALLFVLFCVCEADPVLHLTLDHHPDQGTELELTLNNHGETHLDNHGETLKLPLPFLWPFPTGLTSNITFEIKGIPKPEAQSFTVAFDMPGGILFEMTADYSKGILEGQSIKNLTIYGPENLGKNPFQREEPFTLTIIAVGEDPKRIGSIPFFILKVGNENYRYNVPRDNHGQPIGRLGNINQLLINGDLTLESVKISRTNDN